ncbi:LysR family transcriptional regulator [Bradyrhizobium sp. KB893862 SZCCT0404]|uniref:LysR family transcriptional regulator n=1 Tax=Bradyrhizobium sp. KB893862 SZCCT0404 TaxID=2807672 RepID=UPI001BAAE441|nr:LysR family transcriptional regulator [Bradyrhizobium sp. KB893862 SZCCT0404]MBR1175280.1 LysR family transcriptional regulator [Bradyrhizobium sp. KB893862 SZCCT0404]
MRFEGLDLNLLVALNAILEERSVKAASERLCLSQPAMSAAVSRLRQYFNDEIFTINHRKLTPTPLAQSLEAPTRDILLRIRTNLISGPSFEPAKSRRRFRLVVSDYASMVLIQPVMKRVYRAAPDISVDLLPFTDRTVDQLQRGDVDFVVLPDPVLIEGHPHQPLFSDEFCCVAWTASRRIGRSISLNRYLQLGHIGVQYGALASIEEQELLKLGCKRRIEVLAPNFTMMAIMVIGTDRIATVHERLAAILARKFPLKMLRAPVRIPQFRENLQWPASFHLDPALVWLRGIISEVAQEIDRTPAAQMTFG